MEFISWHKERVRELVELWNDTIGESFPMSEELFIQNSFNDINIFHNASKIVVHSEKEQIVGFIVVKKWQDHTYPHMPDTTAWIQVLLVHRDYRNRGIGKALLEQAETELKKYGIKEIKLGQDPWHYFPGIPEEFFHAKKWFEQQKYVLTGKQIDLHHYFPTGPNDKPSKSGVTITTLKTTEKDQFLSFLQQTFPGRWEYEAIQYFKHGGTGREFVVLKKNHEMIGFCRMNDSDSPVIGQNVYWSSLFSEGVGGIGPLGISEEERGHGYGKLIVQAAIYYLRSRGIHHMVVDWTTLEDFYRQFGFKVWKSYWTYYKICNEE